MRRNADIYADLPREERQRRRALIVGVVDIKQLRKLLAHHIGESSFPYNSDARNVRWNALVHWDKLEADIFEWINAAKAEGE